MKFSGASGAVERKVKTVKHKKRICENYAYTLELYVPNIKAIHHNYGALKTFPESHALTMFICQHSEWSAVVPKPFISTGSNSHLIIVVLH